MAVFLFVSSAGANQAARKASLWFVGCMPRDGFMLERLGDKLLAFEQFYAEAVLGQKRSVDNLIAFSWLGSCQSLHPHSASLIYISIVQMKRDC